MQVGAQWIMHAIAFVGKAQINNEWNRIVGRTPKWLCMPPFLGRGPISMHANAFSTRPQEFMQLGAQSIMHAIAFGGEAQLERWWNRIFGRIPTWLFTHPSFGQGAN